MIARLVDPIAIAVVVVVLFGALIAAGDAMAAAAGVQAQHRSAAEKARFARAHPCPSTHKPVVHCSGYVIDHKWPLCAGGADRAENMQWQRIATAKRKDAKERALCRCIQQGRNDCPKHL